MVQKLEVANEKVLLETIFFFLLFSRYLIERARNDI